MPSTALQRPDAGRLLQARTLEGRDIQMPGTFDIYLLSLWLAGTRYYAAPRLRKELREGDPLRFQREPQNAHDPLAVAVYCETGEKLGHMPRRENRFVARLMDAGKYLKGVIRRVDAHSIDQPGIRIRVFMRNL